jgi:hypothetical protein
MGQCLPKPLPPVEDTEILMTGWTAFTDQNRPFLMVTDHIRFTSSKHKIYQIYTLENKNYIWVLGLITQSLNPHANTTDHLIKMSNAILSNGGIEWCPNIQVGGEVNRRQRIE